MRRSVPEIKIIARILPGLFVAFLCMVIYSSSFASLIPKMYGTHLRDSIIVQKQLTSKKYKIRLYPNANHQVLFFSASGEAGRVYQLFLFDIDGKLVKRVNIRNKETSVVNKIDKGTYLFEIFSDDERIENGQVTVR